MPGKSFKMLRPQQLAKRLVVIDGIAQSGKQLIAHMICTLKGSEMWQWNPIFDNLTIAHHLGRISHDAAEMLVNFHADQDLYNFMIGRYMNFRKTDETGVYVNRLSNRYVKRLAMPDGDAVVNRVKKDNPLFTIMTHHNLGASDLFFKAFDDRLKLYIVSVRHPLWFVNAWVKSRFYERIGKQLREFQLTCVKGGKCVPWFAVTWHKEYLNCKPVEQAIRIAQYFSDAYRKRREQLSARYKKKLLFIPLEKFITQPYSYLSNISARLNAAPTPITKKVFRYLNIPRPIEDNFIDKQKTLVEPLLQGEKTGRRYKFILNKLCADYEHEFLKREGV